MASNAAGVLDVDLLAFETGSNTARQATIDGVRRSLSTGFVSTSHDIPEGLLDEAYGMLAQFFELPASTKQAFVVPASHGQTGYTGLLVETAASAQHADWKEMLNWGREQPSNHPLVRRFPHRYLPPVLPEAVVPGITEVLGFFHDRVLDLQRRFLRIIAVCIGCDEAFFDVMLRHGPTLTRAIHYPAMEFSPGAEHVWAAEHGDINLITALPRATARGLQVKLADGSWVDAVPPPGKAVINTGMMLELLTNGMIATGIHRVVADDSQPGERYSVVQFCHPTPWTVLSPVPSCVTMDRPLRFPSLTAGDRLDEVLWEINLLS